MEPLPSTGSVGALAVHASQIIRQTPTYSKNDDLQSIVSHFEDFEGIFQTLSSIVKNIHPETDQNWRRMFLKHGQRFNNLVATATNLAEQLSRSDENAGAISELRKVRKELVVEKSTWNLMLTALNTHISSGVVSAIATGREHSHSSLRRRGANQIQSDVERPQIQEFSDDSLGTNSAPNVDTHHVTKEVSQVVVAGRKQERASADSGPKVPEPKPGESQTVLEAHIEPQSVRDKSHSSLLTEDLIKKAIKEALEEYSGLSQAKSLGQPPPDITGELTKGPSLFYPYKRRFFRNMGAVSTVLTVNAILLFAALCLQVVSMMKQREESRPRKWGDADSLTATQNLMTQLLGLYTTFITAIDDDHLFSRLGWPSWTWTFLGTCFPIASLIVYEAFGWVTPLLSFGGTIGNAFLGIVLLNIVTKARKQRREESIQGLPLSNIRIVLNDEEYGGPLRQ